MRVRVGTFTIFFFFPPHISKSCFIYFFCLLFFSIYFYFLKKFIYLFIYFLISWRLITLQYCSGFCHTLTWISHGFTCIPHPDPPSHLPLHLIPLGLPSAPGPSTCLMHSAWAGDLHHLFNCYPLVSWKTASF